MQLIIDSGNSLIKAAVFHGEKLVYKETFEHQSSQPLLNKIINENKIDQCLVSDVSGIFHLSTGSFPVHIFSHQDKLPFFNHYKTPYTLGLDRMAAIAGSLNIFPKKNILVIDAGTCIKYDAIDKDRNYYGGAISPGIRMRYKALHQFTGKLPEIEHHPASIIFEGIDTETSIISGVTGAAILEVKGFIDYYSQKYYPLEILFTGGDGFVLSQYFNFLFDPDLIIRGLNEILLLNLPPQ